VATRTAKGAAVRLLSGCRGTARRGALSPAPRLRRPAGNRACGSNAAATRVDDPVRRGRIQSRCGLGSGDADGLASIPTCNTGAGPETHRA
jgi:hypothetical protein